ncbi:MAG: hypothetical protein JSW39_26150, partial [Desulfobacterales bacterium]
SYYFSQRLILRYCDLCILICKIPCPGEASRIQVELILNKVVPSCGIDVLTTNTCIDPFLLDEK